MSDIIKFEFDQPVEVALRFAEPKVFASQFPGGDDRHMYSTTDGRVMYLTPLASARVKALQLGQGECFWICKRKAGRLTEFAVSREPMDPQRSAAFRSDPQQPAVQAEPPRPSFPNPLKATKLPSNLYYTPGPTLEAQLEASIDMVQRRKLGEQGDGTLAVMAPPAPVKPAAAERMAPAVAEFSSRLIAETTALVDSYAAALKTASERHGGLVNADDVRTFVVTVYINASKNAGRNAA